MNQKQGTEVSFSHNQPIPWRIIDPGLCLEGRCLAPHRRCHAYGHTVIGSLGTGQFTISCMTPFECPLCKTLVRAEKFGLNRCQWRLMNTHKWSNIADSYQMYHLSQHPIHIEIHHLDKDDQTIENCTICLLPMSKTKDCAILPCKHIFHMECIHSWIDADEETSLQCPICRQEIFE